MNRLHFGTMHGIHFSLYHCKRTYQDTWQVLDNTILFALLSNETIEPRDSILKTFVHREL